jgi:hypothetical protein
MVTIKSTRGQLRLHDKEAGQEVESIKDDFLVGPDDRGFENVFGTQVERGMSMVCK